jgi:hypothetical protein
MAGLLQNWVSVRLARGGALSRRSFVRWLAAGATSLGWFDRLTLHADELRQAQKACILLWMAGGPSQFETFDPKPGTATQGPSRAISTSVPGIAVAEHWPHVAQAVGELTIIRSMTSKEGNHGRATYLLHTGYAPSGGIVHPGFGSVVASELGPDEFDLPHFVSIQGPSIGPSFLGVPYAPFVVSDPNRPPDNLATPVPANRLERRLGLLNELEAPAAHAAALPVKDHQVLYQQTARMVSSPRVKAFELDAEPQQLRDAYGRSSFGQGCLMARRLVEAGVTFVEVQSAGWDTHAGELAHLKKWIPPVDQGMAALLTDLKVRGLLDRTLVIWMGEFGRMPYINLTGGRDHFPSAFNVALAGCGVKGGQAIGATNRLGTAVASRPVTVPDLFCTFCRALGIDPRRENQSNVGRPIPIVEGGKVVAEAFS